MTRKKSSNGSSSSFGSSSTDYVERLNRALDYIVGNLDQPLRLKDVARAACLSPFHFHRVFRSVIGETLNRFVKRQRLERAMFMMKHASGRSLTEIALDCGFSSSSDFSRSFKNRYGASPSTFDMQSWRDAKRSALTSLSDDDAGRYRLDRLPAGANPDGFSVRLSELPPRSVAYIRVLDPYQPKRVPEAAARLVAWAEARGLAEGRWLGYMWEDPEIVALSECRYDVAVEVDGVPAPSEGEVGRHEFSAMRVAEIPVSGTIDLEQRALDWLFGTWLPQSGFVPDDQPCFEAWRGRPFAHGLEHFELSVQLPVTKA